MSITAMAWAWNQQLPATPKMVLLALADCHNGETGQCNPSMKYIAAKAGLCERTIEYHMLKLVAGNLVTITHNLRPNGSMTSSNYYLALPGASPAPGEPDAPPGATDAPPGACDAPLEPVIEPVIEPSLPSNSSSSAIATEEELDGRTRKKKPDPHVKLIMDTLEGIRGKPSPSHGAEAKAVKWMLDQDYHPDMILDCYHSMLEDPFWQDKTLLMMSVQKRIISYNKNPTKLDAQSLPPREPIHIPTPDERAAQQEAMRKYREEVRQAQQDAGRGSYG